MRRAEVRREDGALVCDAEVADNPFTRARGLLGRKGLAVEAGLLIQPCTSVHSLFMRFTIDVVYLDAENRIVKAATLKPFRLSMGGKGAKRTLELPQGRIEAMALEPGMRLQVERSGVESADG